MGTRTSPGFTIIETTLFLAVSSLLILLMIAGTGASLNTQRYRDAVQTFKSLVQQQYADLSSVQNGREANWTCDSTSTVIEDGSDDKIRGQSDCFMIGKYMRIEGSAISVYTVLASQIADTQSDDIASLVSDYSLNTSMAEVEEHTMEWSTQIAWATAGTQDFKSPQTPRDIGMLFVRSPDSGLIYTFTSDSIPAKDSINQSTFTNLLVAGPTVPGQAGRTICIESGGLFVNGDMGLYITPYATSSSSIETRTNDVNRTLQGAGASQC